MKDIFGGDDNFEDLDERYASPKATKRNFDFLCQAPEKNFDNREVIEMSPLQMLNFDDDEYTLFPSTDEPTTPEKRPTLCNYAPDAKPKVQISFSDSEPVLFDYSQKLFPSDGE